MKKEFMDNGYDKISFIDFFEFNFLDSFYLNILRMFVLSRVKVRKKFIFY